jgi:hypothetical protein
MTTAGFDYHRPFAGCRRSGGIMPAPQLRSSPLVCHHGSQKTKKRKKLKRNLENRFLGFFTVFYAV